MSDIHHCSLKEGGGISLVGSKHRDDRHTEKGRGIYGAAGVDLCT